MTLRILFLFATILATSPLSAETFIVDAKPDAAPFQTIQAALNAAKAGDTVRVRAGTYRERVAFKNSGEHDKLVVLEGEPGAAIDGSSAVELNWKAALDVGPGVYRAAVEFHPYTVATDGKLITMLDEKRVDPATQHSARDSIRWPEAFKNGVGESGWDGVRALAMYRHKEKELLIRFKDQNDPATMKITVAPREPCISIVGVSHCVVRGFKLGLASYGVLIRDSSETLVEQCRIHATDYGIELQKGTDHCVVRHNEISMDPYAGADPWREGSWDNWEAHKNGGYYDRYGVRSYEGIGGHEIHDNAIHDHWDGIDSGYPGDPEVNGNLDIHHNYLFNIFDDAFETSGGQMNNQWHDNIIERARVGTRIKSPYSGPLYIYRNIYLQNKNDIVIWSGKELKPCEVWIYHNTSTSDVSIGTNYASEKPVSTANYHVYNNLFWCLTAMRREAKYPLPDWKADHNVYVQATTESPRPGEAKAVSAEKLKSSWEKSIDQMKQAGIDKNSTWLAGEAPGFADVAKKDLSLTETSPARGKGMDLSKMKDGSLPGCEAGYFKGEKPDAGALSFGEAMPKLPRAKQ